MKRAARGARQAALFAKPLTPHPKCRKAGPASGRKAHRTVPPRIESCLLATAEFRESASLESKGSGNMMFLSRNLGLPVCVAVGFLAIGTVLFGGPASRPETAVTTATIDNLIQKADIIAEVLVTTTSSSWETNRYGDRLIYTTATSTPLAFLKGRPESMLRFRVKGGVIDGYRLDVSGQRIPVSGRRLLVFLRNVIGALPEQIGIDAASIDLADRVVVDGAVTSSASLLAIIQEKLK
jgi:hypothetical protein